MAGMGDQEEGAPHPGLSAQLCCSVAVAGCTCQPSSQERVRVWGGCRFTDRWHRLRSEKLGGGNVDMARLVSRRFETKSLSFMAN